MTNTWRDRLEDFLWRKWFRAPTDSFRETAWAWLWVRAARPLDDL